MVIMDTTLGIITIELWPDKAPVTVENFLQYVDEDFYNGTIFHRVIPDFMNQGGGFLANMESRETRPPIANEARADTPNDRGTIAMARTDEINSATAQFFINARDNDFLNHRDETSQGFGYCVFGRVVEGMDVADKINRVATGEVKGYQDMPLKPVIIRSISRAEPKSE